jgi:hypothetical protein
MDNLYFKILVRYVGRQLCHPTSAQGQRGTGCSHALQDLAAIPFFSHLSFREGLRTAGPVPQMTAL